MNLTAWRGFTPGNWQERIDVAEFIRENYSLYTGDERFLAGATPRTVALHKQLENLLRKESENGGVLDIASECVLTPTAFGPGYLDKQNEIIVGMQTDAPLKRGVNPFGGMRMARAACEAYGHSVSPAVEEQFRHHKTHNDGVFSAYTPEIKAARKVGLITGLPDAYGRGRIIGDYRRLALYGLDQLVSQKRRDRQALEARAMDAENIRALEENAAQTGALLDIGEMAALYGYDVALPASTARQAVQWLYFAYLAAIKEQNGAAMSLGRVSTFLDIYFERDMAEGLLDETGAQEIFDDFVLKLRMARHLRTPDYNELFGGDPMWITEALGGMTTDRRPLVTKSCYRMLHTLYNLGPSAEPNLTILWSDTLPEPWKQYVAKVSCETDALQYENDDLMRPQYGEDYAIACCVSAMRIGREMQFFGARTNLAKLLLLALNGGRDEETGLQVGPEKPVYEGEILQYDAVVARLNFYRPWLAATYVSAMNIIHYMHDKYAYEKTQMALHDSDPHRLMAFGVAGLSVLADSLSAIKYAQVRPLCCPETGLITGFVRAGDYPAFGNDDDRVDMMAAEQVERFYAELCARPLYRDAEHTLSVLTITSNVTYGKKTGATPDGREAGQPFAPGANPMAGREKKGALAALNSVAKLRYSVCRDGISNTLTLVPSALGRTKDDRKNNLMALLSGYFAQGAHHLNVNVLRRETLEDAYNHPEKYPSLTIRVSGYAVNFCRLSREQQREVISRTVHTQV